MKQPNRWSCLPTAFAIALNVPVEELITVIGHDGSQIMFPDEKFPANMRGFHPQELFDACAKLGTLFVTIEPYPCFMAPSDHNKIQAIYDDPIPRFTECLRVFDGVLIGATHEGQRHAIAWFNGKIIDPSGRIDITLDNFQIEYFYGLVHKGHLDYLD